MRRITNMFRNRNYTKLFYVLRDGSTSTIEVWACDAATNRLEHQRTWPFTVHPDGWHHRSSSELRATREATEMAHRLSREANGAPVLVP